MNKVKFKGLDLTLYKEKLKNGLEIYVVPFSNVNNNYVTFTTKYGSVNNEFVPIDSDSMFTAKVGIAHFLEHKLFEQKDGIDPFTFFSERGADANASTTYFKTTYLFAGPDFLEENVNYLLDYVQSPYFTDKNVDKEKGIIEQEIKMYQDDPFTVIREKNLYNIFNIHPYKYPIIGSIKSINSITKEDLYTCYNTFYHPANMFITVTGNVNPEEVIKLIKENQDKKKFMDFKPIEQKKYKEPNKVCKEYEELFLNNITIPKIIISYKIDLKKLDKLSKPLLYNYFNILFDIKFGVTSEIVKKLKEESLIIDELYISGDMVDDYLIMSIALESNNVKEVIKEITNELNDLNVSINDFERKKKVMISGNILGSDSIFAINSKIMANLIYYDEILCDSIEMIKNMNMEELNYIIDNVNLKNKSITVVKSKENK